MDNSAFGSVLSIPKDLLDNLEDIDKKVARLQETSSATSRVFNDSFASMALSTSNLEGALQKVLEKMSSIGNLSGASASASQAIGSGMDIASRSTENMYVSVSRLMEQMRAMTITADNFGKSGSGALEEARLRANMLFDAMSNPKMGGNIAQLQARIEEINTSLKDTETSLSKEAQDRLVKEKNMLQETLKEAKRTQEERLVNLLKVMDRMSAAEEAYQKKISRASEEAAKAEERKREAIQRTAERQIRWESQQRAMAEKGYRQTFSYGNYSVDSALGIANSANSIKDRAEAIKILEAVRAKLNATDAKGRQEIERLNAKIKELNAANKQAVLSSKELVEQHNRLLDTASQLQRAFALLFSVSQIKGFISEVAETRGYFELQQKSLQAILQNKQQADEIFGKTMSLALESPFRAKELITYTKQLAAYRIENEKLYKTTKNIADISAGLGVDAQRLILAYGQVKAAAYLRGTEVRQFTEAGINMYGELQKLFKERDNADYTTAQIVDMISKRKVAFDDVEEIFNRLTSKGGLFYNMQQIQVETLQGKLGKLKDAIDQMQNAIGKANEGAFKGVVDFGITLVQNWEAIANAGEALAGVLVLLKMQSIATGVAFSKVLTAEFATAPVKVKLFSTALAAAGTSIKNLALSMKAAFASNPITAGLMIAAGIAYKLYSRYSEIQEKLAEINKEYSNAHRQITAISDEYTYIAKSESDNLNAKRDAIKKLIESANQSGLKIKVDVEKIDDDKLDEEFNRIKGKYEEFALTVRRIMARIAENGGFLTDNIDEDAGDYAKAAQKIIAHSEMIDDALSQVKANYDKIPQSAQKFFDVIKAGRKDGEGDMSYYLRMRDALKEISWIAGTQANGVVQWTSRWRKAAAELSDSFNDLNEQSKEFISELERNMPELKKIADKNVVKSIIDYAAVKGQWDDMAVELAKQHFNVPLNLDVEKIEKQVSWVDQYITDFFNSKSYGVKLDISTDSKALDTFIGKGDDAAKAAKHWEELGKRWGSIMANKAKITVDDELAGILEGTRMQVKVGDAVDTKDVKAIIEEYRKAATELAVSLGVNPFEKSQAKQTRDLLAEQISLLKEMQSRYEKLRMLMRPVDAADNVLEYYRKSLDDVRMPESVMKSFVPTREGVVAALDKIIPTISDFKKRMDAMNLQAELKIEIDKDALDRSLDDAKDAVEEAFNSMKVYADMKKMGMSDEYIQSLLGALPKTYEDVRRIIEEQLGNVDGEAFQKQYNESLLKLERETANERISIVKQLFNDYANSLDEQLQLDKWYADERIKIEQHVADETVKAQMRGNLDKKYAEKTDMNTWKRFQKSDSYVSLFENLDYSTTDAIKSMVVQLDGMRDSLKNLPPEQLKTIVGLIEKLKSELRQRNPIKALADSFKELKNASGKDESQKAIAKLSLALKEASAQFNELSSAVGELTGMMESFGLKVPGELASVLDGLGGALGGLASIDITKPFSIVTGMMKSVASIGNMVAKVFGFGKKDNKLQKQIEQLQNNVDKLKSSFDDLQGAMQDAWNLSTMEEYNRMMQDNIKMQIKSLEAMIKLEEDKKRTDKEKIEEYKEEIEELYDTLEEVQENYYSQLGGFGSEANFKSAAEAFGEAWFDAFNEASDTLDALSGKFDEYFNNLVKKQITYRAAQQALQPLLSALDDALDPEGDGGSALTRKEKEAIMRLKESGLSAFDQLAKDLADAMGISPSASSTLSKLQQGISNITETQASAIESLLNSMRFFLARQSTDVSAIRAIMEAAGNITDSTGGSTLEELRSQTSLLRDIRTILQGVIKSSGHPKFGAGIKVFID